MLSYQQFPYHPEQNAPFSPEGRSEYFVQDDVELLSIVSKHQSSISTTKGKMIR